MKKLKIGILTFHRAHNYGAVLQAYALLCALKNMGHEPEIIDYWPKYRDGHYDIFNLAYELKRLPKAISSSYVTGTIQRTLSLPYKLVNHSKFSGFIKNFLNVSGSPLRHGTDIPDKYDTVIVGSDQIWRYNFKGRTGFDEVYFAKYPDSKRVTKLSYAASMGDRDPDAEGVEAMSGLLKNLDFVGVREEALLQLVKPYAAKPPVMVLDPVFLLQKSVWEKLIKPNPVKKKYLLFYQLLANQEAFAMAKSIAEQKQLQMIEIRGTEGINNAFGSKPRKHMAGPLDFISLIYHADYIVSTSYHGVAFSVLFQKQFCALGFTNKGYRVKSLLHSLGIKQALIQEQEGEFPSIDYSTVIPVLEEMRNSSLSFLKKGIRKHEFHHRNAGENAVCLQE
jgi:hypothetical protein